ncbi:MAG: OmpA family protein [Bacteroidetes bacterium]|nr:OmpA family protein [Bacteroidota bacterium]
MKSINYCIYITIFLLSGLQIFAQENILYYDDFKDYSYFPTGELDGCTVQVKDGKYIISMSDNNTSSFCLMAPFELDAAKDFSIEASIRQTSGSSRHFFGLLWGAEDPENNYCFVINSEGQFIIARYQKSRLSTIGESDSIEAIHGMQMPNQLKIDKKADTIGFYINDSLVFSTSFQSFLGSGIGFQTEYNVSVEVDYIRICQDIGINVIPDLTLGLIKENLGPMVNSEYYEVAPLISPDGEMLYLVVEGDPGNTGDAGDQDIWFSQLQDGKWTKRKNIGFPLNNEAANAIISVSPDNNTLLLMNQYESDGTLKSDGFSISQKTTSGWSVPVDVMIENYYNNSRYVDAFLTADQKTLIISAERDDSYGDRDLYVSFLQDSSQWSEPVNLGPQLNTRAAEGGPFLAADGVTLYFSTKGHPGYGEEDVFLSRRLDDTWKNWSVPENLGPEINTAGGDGYFTIPASGEYAYLVSGSNTLGGSDIFRIKLPTAAKPEPVVLVYGRVLNKKTSEPVQASITINDFTDNKQVGIASSDPSDGSYKIVLPAGKTYSFLAEKEGYYSVSENIEITELEEYIEIERNLYIAPVEVGQTIRLNNILFDFDKATLRPESFPELNRVVKMMNDNVTMKIEIAGHTDNIGSDEYNRVLSEDRAIAVRNYLTENNLAPSRIISKGYGESKPMATNDTEEGRQLNRRVEFTILEK